MIPQQSSAWVRQRIGWLTASRMKDVLAVLKSGQPSESRRRYMMEILTERATDLAFEHYVNPAMQWGIDHEDEAVAEYEARSGLFTDPIGFCPHPSIEFFGATPDRLVGAEGLVEIKCPTTATYMGWVLAGEVPPEHKPQMLAQLSCTRRKWVDFVAYDPRITNEASRMFIRRFQPDPEEITAIENAAVQFLEEVDDAFQLFIQRSE
jgi:predicted phage-related endonuclease